MEACKCVRIRGRSLSQRPFLPYVHEKECCNLASKFTFSFNADSIIDLLVENCYPHFPVEKMETKKDPETVHGRTRLLAKMTIVRSSHQCALHCSEASQEEEGCDPCAQFNLLRAYDLGPPACMLLWLLISFLPLPPLCLCLTLPISKTICLLLLSQRFSGSQTCSTGITWNLLDMQVLSPTRDLLTGSDPLGGIQQ